MVETKLAIVFLVLFVTEAAKALHAAVPAGPVPAREVEALLKQSSEKRQSKQARQYQDRFLEAINSTLIAAMKSCTGKTPDTIQPGSIAFIIGADGRVRRLLWSAEIPMAECIAERLRSITTLPKPPKDNWVDGIGVANHEHAQKNAPVDKPMKMTKEQLAEYDKAIRPYIAKARATYPVAKARFLAGLPSGCSLSVRVRLFDPNGLREDSFIGVTRISGNKITGVLGTVDILKSYKKGQTITVKESQIDNWLILRPDGSEEGNAVGKFLDHDKPN